MKEGYLYMVITEGGSSIHYFNDGELVECISKGEQYPYFKGKNKFQFAKPEDVIEIGKI